MPLDQKQYDIEANNDWAKNIKGEHLYIESAQSGRKGYFCIGCDKQMDAVIRKKNTNYRSYFRHVPVDISKDETPCTFSNRQYREVLATDILQRLKRIKVPQIYKYPPKGKEGAPMLLEKAKYITAHKVRSQLTFYEDNEGAVKYGKNPNVADRYLLIRPDVVFFDVSDDPILFIELVITHKVTEEKKIKLRRLGIDTVSIIVPKSSEQEIEDNFKTTKRVKWEYNEIEANTKYIRVSSRTSEGVLEFDTDQRRIFEESITCRKARLNNALRTIKKCLQSKPYRRAERDFESEISRIEKATKTEREGLERMERNAREAVDFKLDARRKEVDIKLENFEQSKESFESYKADLENRYYTKDREIRESKESIRRDITRSRENDLTREQLERKFEFERKIIESRIAELRERTETIRERRKSLPEKFKRLMEEESARFEREKRRIEIDTNEMQKRLSNFGEHLNMQTQRVIDEFKGIREQTLKRINEEDINGEDELSKRIASISETRRILSNFGERQITYQRHKKNLELIRSGAWEAQ